MKQLASKPVPDRRVGRHHRQGLRVPETATPVEDGTGLPWPDQVYTELTTIGFVTLDRQGRIRELNEKTARLLGFGRNWLRNRPFVVFVAKNDVYRFLKLLMDSSRSSGREIVE